jgi:tetrapyrrole methylase family protein/MazG family protein
MLAWPFNLDDKNMPETQDFLSGSSVGPQAIGPTINLVWLGAVLPLLPDQVQNGYQCVPATYLTGSYHPLIEVNLPTVIQLDPSTPLEQLQRVLRNAFPAKHPVRIVSRAASGELHTVACLLQGLVDAASANELLALYLPPLPPNHSFSALQEIVAHLRSPVGCPWDRAQTLQSLRHDLLSECAEVLEAIDAEANGVDNSPHIAEELGDLLLSVVLMVQIATDSGRFQMADAVSSIVTKLIRRHPHVFGDTVVDGVQTIISNWDAIKRQEKAAKGLLPAHPLDGVPAALPALEKARQLQSKAAKAGLLAREVLVQQSPVGQAILVQQPNEQQFGELLWQLVAVAHQLELNAEDALRAYLVQFDLAQRV